MCVCVYMYMDLFESEYQSIPLLQIAYSNKQKLLCPTSLNRISGYVCVCMDLLESEYDPSKVFI